ncbi:hypothetical protein MGWOODY_Mmi521 [hydrothermal vent metagenome]|uniref:Uncharacterized protein n=1 Tax=hydrothermal vent metagenome TaxID=652676 RepID=A0A160VFM7_9ZZZZ
MLFHIYDYHKPLFDHSFYYLLFCWAIYRDPLVIISIVLFWLGIVGASVAV